MPVPVVAVGILAAIPAILNWVLLLAQRNPLVRFGIVAAIALGVIAVIPWPAWMDDIGSLFGGLPSGLLWMLDIFMLPQGIAIVASAWGLRFLLRWLRAALSAS